MPRVATKPLYERLVTALNTAECSSILLEAKLTDTNKLSRMDGKTVKGLVMKSMDKCYPQLTRLIQKDAAAS